MNNNEYIINLLVEAAELLNEVSYVNDKGKTVPRTCTKCGSPVKVYLKGEPVYLCSNDKCKKYYGTVKFGGKE